MLDHGQILADGNSTNVCNLFFNQSNEKIKSNVENSPNDNFNQTEDLDFTSVEIFNDKHDNTDSIECLSKMNIEISFNVLKPLKNICFLIGIHTPDFVFLTATNSIDETHDYLPGEHRVAMTISSMTLLPGVYSIRVWIGTPEGKVSFDADNLKSFTITSEDHLLTRQQEMGLFNLDANWQFESLSDTTNNDLTS